MTITHERTAERIALLQAVAALLPDFKLTSPGDRQPRLSGPDGMEIFISTSSQRGKLHIHGSWPMDGNAYMSPRSWGAVAYNEDGDVSINVSEERGPEAVAREILRRFLPQYREIHAKCLEAQRTKTASREIQYAAACRLAKAVKLPKPQREDGDREYRMHLPSGDHGYGTVSEVYDKTARLELRSVPHDKAERILKIFMEK